MGDETEMDGPSFWDSKELEPEGRRQKGGHCFQGLIRL